MTQVSKPSVDGLSYRNASAVPDRLRRMWQGWPSVLLGGTEIKRKKGGKYLMHAHLANNIII